MKTIDARGMACPLPVIETKKALKENKAVLTIVDNKIATQNLKKLAEQLTLNYTCETISDIHFKVLIANDNTELREEVVVEDSPVYQSSDEYIVAVDSSTMGQGSDVLGERLLKTFIYTLTEQDVLPKQVIFYNGGVKLVVEGHDAVEDLKTLIEKGVEVYECGACLDFYELTDQVAVGEITNMYRIVEMMREANRIVKP